jgi:hypothetical protein
LGYFQSQLARGSGGNWGMGGMLPGLRNWEHFWGFSLAEALGPLANGVRRGLCYWACGFLRAEVGFRCELRTDWIRREERFRRGDRFGVPRMAGGWVAGLNG